MVSLPDDRRLFVSYSPPVCTFNSVLKWLLWYYVEMRDRYRTGELFSRSEDSIDDAKVWRFLFTFLLAHFRVLAPLPLQLPYCIFWLGDEGSNAVQRCGGGTSVWYIPINIAFVDVGLIGVTVYSNLGKSRECHWLLVYLHGHGASQAGAGL